MFGTLRLVLALMVVASHVEIPHQIDLGGVAVTLFFLLSGYVMTATVRRYYNTPQRYSWFLADRAGRILPQYIFWTVICILWVAFADRPWAALGWQEIVENIALLPSMFAVFNLKPWLTGVRYITQTWSLSLECYFYLLLPWLILFPRTKTVAGVLSMSIFTLASLHIIDPYVHAYRLLPGVLFVFLLGSIVYDELDHPDTQKTRLLLPFVYIVLLGSVANSLKTLHYPWITEVYLGIIVGLPLLRWLARLGQHPVDNWLGNLSYGVFLCHNLVLRVIYRFDMFHDRWLIFCVAAGVSTILGGIAYYAVERPIVSWRHKLRQTKTMVEP